MFKGVNFLELSPATMCEVVAYWLRNSTLRHDQSCPNVAEVELTRDGNFRVALVAPDK
jgi:hypothetical protein